MIFPNPQAATSVTFSPPPLDLSLTIPEIFDYHLTHSSKHPIFTYEAPDGGFNTVFWPQAVQAVHSATRFINSKLHSAPQQSLGILANAGKRPQFNGPVFDHSTIRSSQIL